MNLQQQEQELQRLDDEADAIATFMSSMGIGRLHLIANLANEELVLRYQGKPCDRCQLH